MALILAKLLWLWAWYVAGIVGGVFLHELGHALAALWVTRQRVELEVGRAGGTVCWKLGRLELAFRARGLRYGATRYGRSAETRGRQALVALGGPLASALACFGFGWATVASVVGTWPWIAFLGLSVANFRILLVAIWPLAYRPDGPDGEEWLSDSLDLWRLWRRR